MTSSTATEDLNATDSSARGTADTSGRSDGPGGAAGPTAQSETEPAVGRAAGAASDSCGFGSGSTADPVEAVQATAGEREPSPSALVNHLNLDFPEPLVDVSRILSGGPPPDGIPPIDRPMFQTAASVDWLKCNEPVLSLEIAGEARAYPVQVMIWHEIVNDTFSDLPVTVSYCPLCNSALAYKRMVAGRVLSFGTSGSLYNSSLVMYDRQTESLWTHFNGQAVVGTLTGTELELLAIQTTSWANFLDGHPDGLVLTRDTGFVRRYGENPYVGYDDVRDNPFLYDGEYDDRLAAKERVVAIRSNGDSIAVVLESLAEVGVIAAELDGDNITVWHLPGTASALEGVGVADGRDVGAVGVFRPEVDGQPLTFSRTGDGYFIDAQTQSMWSIQGRAIDGPMAGTQLTAVEHLDTFWFALAAFEPDTRIVIG